MIENFVPHFSNYATSLVIIGPTFLIIFHQTGNVLVHHQISEEKSAINNFKSAHYFECLQESLKPVNDFFSQKIL